MGDAKSYTLFISLASKQDGAIILGQLLSMSYGIKHALNDKSIYIEDDNNATALMICIVEIDNKSPTDVNDDVLKILNDNKIKYYSLAIFDVCESAFQLGNMKQVKLMRQTPSPAYGKLLSFPKQSKKDDGIIDNSNPELPA